VIKFYGNWWLRQQQEVCVPTGIRDGFLWYDYVQRKLLDKLIEYWITVQEQGYITLGELQLIVNAIEEKR
jgi:hypothetical protein